MPYLSCVFGPRTYKIQEHEESEMMMGLHDIPLLTCNAPGTDPIRMAFLLKLHPHSNDHAHVCFVVIVYEVFVSIICYASSPKSRSYLSLAF